MVGTTPDPKDQNEGNNRKSKSPSEKAILAIAFCMLAGCATILIYSTQVSSFGKFVSIFGIALFIAGASAITGGLLGFLFGIPKTLQQEKPDKATKDEQDKEKPADRNSVSYQANTNLEQISDWLTKILVGVGLTQLNSLPGALRSFGEFCTPGLGNKPESPILAIVILFFFSICGFLICYLWTRLYFGKELRKADLEMFGDQIAKVENKVNELEKQAETDARAMLIAQRQLNPGSDTPPVSQAELDAAIKAASPNTKAQIYYLAQDNRSKNWEEHSKKVIMERSIPIFRALIASDTDNVYHLNHGQLGFALKDQRKPDWKEAESELTKAIGIRGPWKKAGWLFYEFNRAICRMNNDDNYKQDLPSGADVKDLVNADLKAAGNADMLKDIITEDPHIQKWLAINKKSKE